MILAPGSSARDRIAWTPPPRPGLNEYLPQALGRIGRPAVEPLRAALFDPDLHTWGLITAANGLRHAAEHHPELRDEVVRILTERLDVRDDPRDDVADLNGTIVAVLCDLKATESLRSIRRAFHDERSTSG